jgi:hypothetical protein
MHLHCKEEVETPDRGVIMSAIENMTAYDATRIIERSLLHSAMD